MTPYRGAGRPHGAFVMERVIGLIARELGLEPVEVRRRNLIQPDEFPWDVGLTFQDGGPTRYDSGNYPAGLEMALAMIGYARVSRAPGGRARRGPLSRPGRRRATSRARASARTRARTCASSRAARSSSRPASRRTGRATRRRSPRSPRRRSDAIAGRRHGRDRRHRPVQLGRRHVREPRAGHERQRRVASPRARCATRRCASPGELLEASPGRPRAGGRSRPRQGRARPPAHARRPRHRRQSDPLRLRQGGRGGRAQASSSRARAPCSRDGEEPGLEAQWLLRAAPGHVRERLPRRDRRGRRRAPGRSRS